MGCRTPFVPPGDYHQTQPFHTAPISCCPNPHLALDMVGRDAQVAYAINAGRVWKAGWDGQGFAVGGGYSVIILHGPASRPTMKTSYCHGKGMFVRAGQLVLPGQKILSCDNKGNSSGSHLHHDVQLWSSGKWVAVDPHSVYPAHTWKNGKQAQGSRFNDSRAKTCLKVTGTTVNFRKDATTASAALASLKAGQRLVFDGTKNGQIPSGMTSPIWNAGFYYNGNAWIRGYLHSQLSGTT